jgi:hypothetical protein
METLTMITDHFITFSPNQRQEIGHQQPSRQEYLRRDKQLQMVAKKIIADI